MHVSILVLLGHGPQGTINFFRFSYPHGMSTEVLGSDKDDIQTCYHTGLISSHFFERVLGYQTIEEQMYLHVGDVRKQFAHQTIFVALYKI
jgi:hypothetical protein